MSRWRALLLFVPAFTVLAMLGAPLPAQEPPGTAVALPVQYEELTAPDFVRAVTRSGFTAIIPMGILEKHGPQLPLGTDLLDVREVALRAAKKEYAIVFPQYYFGQIFEAKHQPGTIAYSQKLMWDVLQETCDELARNGIKKIILVSGHGGNNSFLPYFCQSQLASRKDYAVFLFRPPSDPETDAQVKKMRKTTMEAHAGEVETSMILAHRPDLVRLDQAKSQEGIDLKRMSDLSGIYTGIWWYASFPNHYAGDGSSASKALGELVISKQADQLAKVIKQVKTDKNVLELQKRFYDEAEKPLQTKQ
jgi:creatinine amidohydrolase